MPPAWRYRLGVRTEDSQSSNPGSIPGSATSYLLLSPVISYACRQCSKRPGTRHNTWWGTVAAQTGHNLGHSHMAQAKEFFFGQGHPPSGIPCLARDTCGPGNFSLKSTCTRRLLYWVHATQGQAIAAATG